MKTNGCGCGPIKFYYKNRQWPKISPWVTVCWPLIECMILSRICIWDFGLTHQEIPQLINSWKRANFLKSLGQNHGPLTVAPMIPMWPWTAGRGSLPKGKKLFPKEEPVSIPEEVGNRNVPWKRGPEESFRKKVWEAYQNVAGLWPLGPSHIDCRWLTHRGQHLFVQLWKPITHEHISSLLRNVTCRSFSCICWCKSEKAAVGCKPAGCEPALTVCWDPVCPCSSFAASPVPT